MKIIRNGTTSSVKGSANWFTGDVRIDYAFMAEEEGRSVGAIVTFEPSARSNWHSHPGGQSLIVLNGVGWTQCEGGPRTEIRAGDVIWCPCKRHHWHGASASTAMTHVAVTETIDGRNTDWMEPVTDEQYHAGALVTE
jgi:quercetin dioxygenase-like cupin family protein